MKISIDTSILDLFPDLEIYGLVMLDLYVNTIGFPVVQTFHQPPNPEKVEEICKIWKEVYKSFPKEKKSRVSLEYLNYASVKQTLKHIHPLVDIYNEASLLSLSPFGGEDIQYLNNSLKISTAMGSEPFLPLGKTLIEYPKVGEVVWLDGENQVVCRSMNWLESDIHKITKQTCNVIFVSEKPIKSLPNPSIGIDFLIEKLQKCSSSYKGFVLDKNTSSITL